MGNVLSNGSVEIDQRVPGRKRKAGALNSNERSDVDDDDDCLDTPQRKKLKSTSKYIYDTLFVKGENSDVKIRAIEKEWHLHKVYLCQAAYFSGMFSGSWKESDEHTIKMEIIDDNITQEALTTAFGSLYTDEVSISPTQVIGVLASATLIGLDGLITQCVELMLETIGPKTVCTYCIAAHAYGQMALATECDNWLKRNLMTSSSVYLLKEISCDKMLGMVNSPDLCVIQVEMDVYSTLKKWTFLQQNPTWDGGTKDLLPEADKYFKEKGIENKTEFLHTSEGAIYMKVFQALRLQHIINDLASTKVLEADRIIPKEWLLPVYRMQWQQMLRMEQGIDVGPDEEDNGMFSSYSMRCGRVLQKEGPYCWRWTGFNFGIDLLVSVSNRLISFKRNTNGQICSGAVSLQSKRYGLYKISVCSLDNKGRACYTKSSDIQRMVLGRDEEVIVMHIERTAQYPLHISANFLMYKPPAKDALPWKLSSHQADVTTGRKDAADEGDEADDEEEEEEDS